MYQFPLQKVLDYRKNKEDEAQRHLSKAVLETEVVKTELTKLHDDLGKVQEEFSQCQSAQIDIQHALLACDYTNLLGTRIKEREDSLSRLEARLQEQIRLTEKAMQDRKVMDTLRDKGQLQYQHEQNQVDQRQNDEMARFMYQWHNRQE